MSEISKVCSDVLIEESKEERMKNWKPNPDAVDAKRFDRYKKQSKERDELLEGRRTKHDENIQILINMLDKWDETDQ